jgi:hypothetical protein
VAAKVSPEFPHRGLGEALLRFSRVELLMVRALAFQHGRGIVWDFHSD